MPLRLLPLSESPISLIDVEFEAVIVGICDGEIVGVYVGVFVGAFTSRINVGSLEVGDLDGVPDGY